MIKHTATCCHCKVEVEARFSGDGGQPRFMAPFGWLTIDYRLVDKTGRFVVIEDQDACPDCAPKILEILKTISSS